MEDLNKIQEFFSKSLEEVSAEYSRKNKRPIKVGDIVGNTVQGFDFKVLGIQDDKMKVMNIVTGKEFTTDIDNMRLSSANNPVKEGGVAGWKKASMSMIKHIQKQLDDMGVKYEMGDTPYAPFKTIYKPINKSDDWYDKFNDLIFRANLKSVVKTSMKEGELNEAYVPSNIAEFAKRKGVSSLVKTVAGWAEKVGKRIVGGTAIGKNYDTLILDMTYQGSEIRINTEYETIELYDEPVRTFAQFKSVYEENQEENLDEATNDSRIDNPKFGPAPKQFADLRAKLGDKSFLDKIQMINVNVLRDLLDELDSYNLEEVTNDYSPLSYATLVANGKMEMEDAMKETGYSYVLLKQLVDKVKGVAQNIREEQEDKIDIVTMDVPLFIRALEYAKEDAQEDMDLHNFAERAIAATKKQGILQMDDYEMLVGDQEPMNEVEIGDKVKINKEYGGGKGKVTNKIGSFIVVNGKSYHESDVEKLGMNEETGYSQYLKDDPEFPGGKTKGLTQDVMDRILMKIATMGDDDREETTRLGEGVIYEELCPKGKAYIKKRQAAGEKSSAYLSGRAVKVCKGQMKG